LATPKQIARQEKLIAQGMTRFILVYGVLGFGLLFFVIRTLFTAATGALSLKFIVILAIMCAIGGAIWGLIMWLLINWQYRKVTQSK
jgi:hypothetical protein